MLAHAVDYGPDGPVDYASGARCGLCGFATVDFPALRARAHLSGSTVLWIREERGGGLLRPHTPQAGLSPARFASCGCSFWCSRVQLTVLWITWLRSVDEWIRGPGFGVSPSFVGRPAP